MRGTILQQMSFDLDAIEDFTKAIEQEPDDSNNFFMRSLSLGAVGDVQRHVKDLEETIRVAGLGGSANQSHNEMVKEQGFKSVAQFYQHYLTMAQMHLESETQHEELRRKHPSFNMPSRAEKKRAAAKRRQH